MMLPAFLVSSMNTLNYVNAVFIGCTKAVLSSGMVITCYTPTMLPVVL